MNYVQPQSASAPMPQQVQQPGYAPQQPQPQVQPQVQPQQQVQQPGYASQQVQQVQQPQGVDFFGATLNPQDMQVINQMYGTACQALNTQVSDRATIEKSLYFGARDLFKTIYVNQVSSQTAILILKKNREKFCRKKGNGEAS